jgi:hypothetical protein
MMRYEVESRPMLVRLLRSYRGHRAGETVELSAWDAWLLVNAAGAVRVGPQGVADKMMRQSDGETKALHGYA